VLLVVRQPFLHLGDEREPVQVAGDKWRGTAAIVYVDGESRAALDIRRLPDNLIVMVVAGVATLMAVIYTLAA
jgi:hypothetical protein